VVAAIMAGLGHSSMPTWLVIAFFSFVSLYLVINVTRGLWRRNRRKRG